jgi:hypothetical protein
MSRGLTRRKTNQINLRTSIVVKPQCPAKCRSFVVWMCGDAEYARHAEILSYQR